MRCSFATCQAEYFSLHKPCSCIPEIWPIGVADLRVRIHACWFFCDATRNKKALFILLSMSTRCKKPLFEVAMFAPSEALMASISQ